MSVRMFGVNCDQCPAMSEEYGCFAHCKDCLDDICPACEEPGTNSEDESNEAQCRKCAESARDFPGTPECLSDCYDNEKHVVGCVHGPELETS